MEAIAIGVEAIANRLECKLSQNEYEVVWKCLRNLREPFGVLLSHVKQQLNQPPSTLNDSVALRFVILALWQGSLGNF